MLCERSRVGILFGTHPQEAEGLGIIVLACHDSITKRCEHPLSFGIVSDMLHIDGTIQLYALQSPRPIVPWKQCFARAIDILRIEHRLDAIQSIVGGRYSVLRRAQ